MFRVSAAEQPSFAFLETADYALLRFRKSRRFPPGDTHTHTHTHTN